MCFLIIDSNDIDFIFLSTTFLDENNLSLEFDTIFYSVHCNVKCIAALNLSGTLYTNRFLTVQLKIYPMFSRKWHWLHYKHISLVYNAFYFRFVSVKCFWQRTLKKSQNQHSLKTNYWTALKFGPSQCTLKKCSLGAMNVHQHLIIKTLNALNT